MTLSDILDQLKYSELSQTVFGDFHNEESRNRLIINLNSALATIYSRLKLKEELVKLSISTDNSTYYLLEKYTISNGTESTKYILDSLTNSFKESSVIKILAVIDETTSKEIELNNEGNPSSIITRTYNSLYIPTVTEDTEYTVIYRAKPVQIPTSAGDYEYIDVPDYLIEVVSSYIAYKTMMSISDQKQDAIHYFKMYEDLCNKIVLEGLDTKIGYDTFNNLSDRGWV